MTAALRPPDSAPDGRAVLPANEVLCETLSACLGDLVSRLSLLEAGPLDPASRLRMDHVARAVSALSEQVDLAVAALRATPDADEPEMADAGVDADRFHRLLEIAGPETAVELLLRLRLDLIAVREALEAALGGPETDWAALRAQTHVLVGLAGVIGAEPLQHLSEALNASAHRRDRDIAEDLCRDLLPRLDRLILYVARQADPDP